MIRPYMYVFDADTAGASGGPLTNGSNYYQLPTQVTACDRFVLSRVAGIQNVAARWRLYVPGKFPVMSDMQYPVGSDQIFVPSLVYPVDSSILIDLENISLASRATGGTPNYYSQIVFQGQKHLESVPDPITKYKWVPKWFVQVLPFTLDWEGRITPANTVQAPFRRKELQIEGYDFELHQLRIFRTGQTTFSPSDANIKLTVYDSYMNPLMSDPVLDSYLNAASNNYNSQFPAPVVLYPAGSRITFDIYSLQTTANLPMDLQIVAIGMWRYPC